MKPTEWMQILKSGELDAALCTLYSAAPDVLTAQKKRYSQALEAFCKRFPGREDVRLFSAPGRTEIGGNHTDHQNGCVLAGAVNLDVIAVVGFHQEGVVRIKSAGHPEDQVVLSDLVLHPGESGTSTAIVRGIAAQFAKKGAAIGGFDAYTTSDVLGGSGLSSSAAFEVLICTILNEGYLQGALDAVALATISQYAENVYFGKNSGLMDQTASAVGGLVKIDFCHPQTPCLQPIAFDFAHAGLALCITDTKGSHANLTADYAAIPKEMQTVARQFGKRVLREVDESAFDRALPRLREVCSDRALLRAAHFFAETKRAGAEADALSTENIPTFLKLVRESEASSARLLQNLYATAAPTTQPIPLALFVSDRLLGKAGAARVHGGGFAGTIQAFVPLTLADEYVSHMNGLFGENSCLRLRIRPVGGVELHPSTGGAL